MILEVSADSDGRNRWYAASVSAVQIIEDGALAYTLEQAARMCGMSKDLLYRAVKSGELPAKRTTPGKNGGLPSGKIIILRRELEAWLENLPDDWWGLRYT